jgi:hypothetical protein
MFTCISRAIPAADWNKFNSWLSNNDRSIGYYDHVFCVDDMTFKVYVTIEHEECADRFKLLWG